jgi:hypothetical protein
MDLFIDRCQERNILLHTIKEPCANSHVLFLAAPSGIGKTRLVDYVINEYGYRVPYRVKITNGEASETTDGLYFKKLVRLISKNAEKYWKLRSFYQFCQMRDIPGTALRIGINSILPAIGKEIDHITNTMNEADAWMDDYTYYFDLAKEYVISILSSLSNLVVIAMENFQCIDTYSMELLSHILKYSNNVFLFSEYTNSTYGTSVNKLCKTFQDNGIRTDAYSLNKLPKQEILNVLSNNKLFDIISSSYDDSNGNLFMLSLLLNNEDSNIQSLTYKDTIKDTLERLTKPEQIILSSIELHQGQMHCSELEKLDQIVPLLIQENKTIKDNLDYLCQEGLLIINKSICVLAHDSIVSEIKANTQFKQAYIISINAWINYYKQLDYSLELTEEQRLNCDKQVLLLALRKGDYTLFVQELERINRSLQAYPIASLVLFLTALIKQYEKDKINSDWDTVVYRWCIFIYYQCGQFKHILDFDIHTVQQLDDIAKTCYLAALSSEEPVKAESILYTWHKKNGNNQMNLALSLVKLRMLRAQGEIKKCKKLWNKLDKDNTYNQSLLKADVFRYVSLCETSDYNLRISKQKQAYKLYKKQNRTYGLIASSIILSRDLCYTQKLKESEKWLDIAKKQIKTSLYPRHQYYNNAGLLQLFNKSYDSAISYFNRALEICTNSDDIILIKSNKLSVSILTNTFSDTSDELFQRLFNEYFKCNNITDNELLYNCYNYANLRHLEREKQKLQRNYEKLVCEINNPQNDLHYQSNILKYVNGKCLPVFVIDWDIDYYNVLSSY